MERERGGEEKEARGLFFDDNRGEMMMMTKGKRMRRERERAELLSKEGNHITRTVTGKKKDL